VNRRGLVVLAVAVAGLVVGVAAEWIAYGFRDPRLWLPDLAVGWTFMFLGLLVRSLRPQSRIGVLMVATGFTWFAGNFATVGVEPLAWLFSGAVYVHRGTLIHSVLSLPTGRLESRAARAVVTIGYVAAAIPPIARDEIAIVILAALVVATAVRDYARAIGQNRRARSLAVRAALWMGIILAGGAVARAVFPASVTDGTGLLAYQLGLCALGIGMTVALLRPDWERTQVTDLVVQLGDAPAQTLRDALASALGDPTLEIGYRVPGAAGYADAGGRRITPPPATAGRVVTPIDRDGDRIAIIVHDPAVLDDETLLGSVTAAAAMAASNVRLQEQVRGQIEEAEASRRRLLEAGDRERRRLQRSLKDGAEGRLEAVRAALGSMRTQVLRTGSRELSEDLERADERVRRTLDDLQQLARGLYPPALEEQGLAHALEDLLRDSPVPVSLTVSAHGLAREIAAAAYYICAEALVNMAKYARATRGVMTLIVRDHRLIVDVSDDGVGGADPGSGSGLAGLADRIDALGGHLVVQSPTGAGTRLTAELPLDGEAR
jgi:signal transduction histidine kinase